MLSCWMPKLHIRHPTMKNIYVEITPMKFIKGKVFKLKLWPKIIVKIPRPCLQLHVWKEKISSRHLGSLETETTAKILVSEYQYASCNCICGKKNYLQDIWTKSIGQQGSWSIERTRFEIVWKCCGVWSRSIVGYWPPVGVSPQRQVWRVPWTALKC